jgi:hypothetical protein
LTPAPAFGTMRRKADPFLEWPDLRTTPRLRFAAILAPCGLLAACEPIRTADYLQITFEGPAQVDVNCANGGCEDIDTVPVTVTWSDDPLFLDDDQIEIAQYRVDYSVPSVEGDIPFYAGYTTQYLTPGSTVTFSIAPMGQTQRDLLGPQIAPGQTLIVSATLTLGGWDHENEVIGDDDDEAQAPFEIWLADFSEFATETTPTPVTTP